MTDKKEIPKDEVFNDFLSHLEKKVNEINAPEKSLPEKLLSEMDDAGIVYNGNVLHGIGYDVFVEPDTGNHYKFINGKLEEIKINRPEPEIYVVELED